MSISATFFLPAIHERPTGGNLYNRRLIDGIRGPVSVEIRVRGRDRLAASNRSAQGLHVGIVDSLLLHELAECRTWMADLEVDRLVLLVHYLELLNTEHAGRPRAAKERQCVPLFDRLVTTSQFVKRRLREKFPSTGRVVVIRPGLGSLFRTPRPRDVHDPPRILTVASLLPGKRLIEGLEVLVSIEEDWRWTIVGDDSLDRAYARRVRSRISEAPAEARIDLVGPVEAEEIVAHYDAADLFFLPSAFETCSMVTMEAMSRGLPVVARDVGGLGELVDDGITGFLTEPGDFRSAADRVRFLLRNRERRLQMGRAAAKASQSFPSWGEAAARFIHMLEDV